MRYIPHRFAHYVEQMRVFAGKHVPRCGNAATAGWFVYRGETLAIIENKSLDIVFYKGFWLCRQQKRLQPGRRSAVQYLHLAGLALRCSAFECDLNYFVPAS
jgi:hypothetical protein